MDDENPVMITGRNAKGQFVPGNPRCWQKGIAPNPGGRRAGRSLTDVLTARIKLKPHAPDPKKKDTRTNQEMICDALLGRAREGNVKAISEIFDRLEGKARQRVEVTRTPTSLRELGEIEGVEEREVIAEVLELIAEATGVAYRPLNQVDPGEIEGEAD